MSERRYLRCDSCGATLPVPTSREAAATWQIIDRWIYPDTVTMHWCGQCDGRESIIKRLENMR